MSKPQVFNIKKGGVEKLTPNNSRARSFYGERINVSIIELQPGNSGMVHAHQNEQWGICLAGTFYQRIGDNEYKIQQGDLWHIPPNVSHGGRTEESSAIVLDFLATILNEEID
jgi:quercetin dioxygenase-like cupin family protein